MKEFYESSFLSLNNFVCPDWFRNAKFGIWSHWGPQSVPMYGDWYARQMYEEGSEQYLYHYRKYGHPSKFGYKDILKLWKAENFNPDYLMDLYIEAGAKYFVAQAMHHDNFFNYNSNIHRWNSVNIGPHKDIVGLWQNAAKKRGIPFGVSEHLGASDSWWASNKGYDNTGQYSGIPYDANSNEWIDLYHDNAYLEMKSSPAGYTSDVKWHGRWKEVMFELIDNYELDFLYTDGVLPFGDNRDGFDTKCPLPENTDKVYKEGLEVVARLYNKSLVKHNGENHAVYTQKDKRKSIYSVGILDIERSQEPDIKPDPWQCCSCIGGWFYDVRQRYKTPGHVIEMLVDIVSKNGNLLLNIPQMPDGTLDDESINLLKELAKWQKVCGEAIFGTRPFRISGEGPGKVVLSGYSEEAVQWTSEDIRFTQKENTLYAFMMRWPKDGKAVIRSLQNKESIKSVKLLGHGHLKYTQPFGILVVNLPDNAPTEYINVLALEIE